MQIIKSNIFRKFPEIVFGLSTKIGLDRKSPFYFNMSTSVGDDYKTVIKNRQGFFNELGLDYHNFCFQAQIHSDIVNIANSPGKLGEGDALVTDKENLALVVSTADCNNIFIYEPENRVIAAIHSGWKGTEKKIASKTIRKMVDIFNCTPEKMVAFIGPSISKANYEVGAEFKGKFESKYLMPKGEKFLLDLKKANLDMLLGQGVNINNIEVSDLCSFEEEYLHSYRKEGKISGRAWGVISIKN